MDKFKLCGMLLLIYIIITGHENKKKQLHVTLHNKKIIHTDSVELGINIIVTHYIAHCTGDNFTVTCYGSDDCTGSYTTTNSGCSYGGMSFIITEQRRGSVTTPTCRHC